MHQIALLLHHNGCMKVNILAEGTSQKFSVSKMARLSIGVADFCRFLSEEMQSEKLDSWRCMLASVEGEINQLKNQWPPFLQHFLAHQHGCGGRWLLLAAANGAIPRWKPHLLAHPPAKLGGGKLRHPVAHQAHAAPHRTGHLQDLPRAVRQRNPEKAW